MKDAIPIYDVLVPLCERLGLEPKNVRALTLTADGVAVATVYRLNGDGHKYVDADANGPATEAVTFQVRTYA